MPQDNTSKELTTGTRLQSGKYTIERVLGAGGFGITYYARHNTLGHYFAIKEFFISGYCVRNTWRKNVMLQGIDPEVYDKYLQKFIEEAQILAQLDHPNIVKIIDIFQENNTAYIVMPFVDGQTLQQLVEQKGRLDYETAVNYIAQLSDAVDYIHQRNILHRDIKPDNVIITPENNAILIDFGSAREFINDKTQQHTTIYTQGYAPLEQYAANSRKGSYSDIYSLGAVFYFTLSGEKPMDAATRMGETMPEPKALVSSIPDEANQTIMKAMSLKPEDRQQNIKEFMEDLLNKKRKIVSPSPKFQAPPKKETSSKTPIILFTILISVLIIGVGSYFGVKKWQADQQELTAYNNVISADNITDCDNYLTIYPDGKHRTDVQNLRDKLQQKKDEEERERIAQEQEKIAQQNQKVQDYYNMGYDAAKNGLYDLSLQYFQKAIDIDPNNAELFFGMGYVYAKQENLQQAMTYYNKTLQINPNHEYANLNLGVIIYYYTNDRQKGLEYINKAANLGNQDAQKWLQENSAALTSNYVNTIRGLLQAEEARDFSKIYSYFSPNMRRYYNLTNPDYYTLKNRYEYIWGITSNAQNYVQSIEKGSEDTYYLHTNYQYYSIKQQQTMSVNSVVCFVFDSTGKIVELYDLK